MWIVRIRSAHGEILVAHARVVERFDCDGSLGRGGIADHDDLDVR